MKAARALLIAGAVACATTAPAGAAHRTLVSGQGLFSTPAVSGSGVIVGVALGVSGTIERAPRQPGRPTVLLAVSDRGHGTRTQLVFDASPSTLAVVRYRSTASSRPVSDVLLAGPIGGTLVEVETCRGRRAYVSAASPAADGTLTAFAGGDCSAAKALIHDTAGGDDQTVDAGGPIRGLAIAGDTVAIAAIIAPATVLLTVFDHATGGTVSTTTVHAPSGRVAIDVQEDGTVVVATLGAAGAYGSAGCGARAHVTLAWLAGPTPALNPIPLPTCRAAVKIAGNQVAYLARGTGGDVLSLATLAGVVTRRVANLGRIPDSGAFDLDGTALAWTQTGCRSRSVRTRAASDTSPAEHVVACPVTIGSPRLEGDRIVEGIGCPNGCRSGRGGGISIVSPRWLRSGTDGKMAFGLAPGFLATLEFPVTPSQAARVRAAGTVRVTIRVAGQHIAPRDFHRKLHLPQITPSSCGWPPNPSGFPCR